MKCEMEVINQTPAFRFNRVRPFITNDTWIMALVKSQKKRKSMFGWFRKSVKERVKEEIESRLEDVYAHVRAVRASLEQEIKVLKITHQKREFLTIHAGYYFCGSEEEQDRRRAEAMKNGYHFAYKSNDGVEYWVKYSPEELAGMAKKKGE